MKPIIRKKTSKNRTIRILIILVLFITLFLIIKGLLLLPPLLENLSFLPHKLTSPLLNSSARDRLSVLCQKYDLDLYKINFKKDYYEIYLSNNIVAYLKNSDLEKQVASLQFILKRFKIEGRKIKVIDLRFSKPIIN